MKKLLEFIVKAIVQQPEKVKVQEKEVGELLNLSLTAAPEDMGKIIGKKGRIIRAVRDLIRLKAGRLGKRTLVNLEEQS